uniref:Uncharacterized protein n=1 Tax=Oryza punctata TaxID=4537 RepID=A0A0E0LVQ2_ORYPU
MRAREAFTKHDRHLAARTVLDVTRSLGFADRSMIWLPSSDTVWKTLRGITAANIFSPRGLAALRGVRESKVRDLMGYFRGRDGDVVDIRHAVYGCMLSLVSSAFFSVDVIVRENVTIILLDVFIAGSDTITATVEWAMAELFRNPSEMAKVRAEMDGALGGNKSVDEPDIAKLPYLQAVVKEAMRLHPAAPLLLPHKAVEDGVEIGGFAVSNAWERPEEFMPERFIRRGDDEVDLWGKTFEFIPFGSGRRVCAGLPMAERVVPFMLASLLHAFEWRLPDGVSAEELDMSQKFTIANFRTVPLKAVPVVVS